MAEIQKVLIANRGEIAVRVIRAVRDVGLSSVAVYADPDRDAPHVCLADEAISLGGSTATTTYLAADKLLDAARRCFADAVHPGYGFLSENADFADAVIAAGLTWIGPDPHAIRELGNKVTARRIAAKVNAPLMPGTADPVACAAEVINFAQQYGLPVAIKAAFGGGGRGLKVARTIEEIPESFESATREAVAAFGRGACFVERYLDRPRHVEAQVLADQHSNIIVVGTRDCSLQRRHQKLVEEAPAPFLSEEQRRVIHDSAKAICRAAGYCGAGTVEFLVGADGTISFLEVNTRLQVEHPVTEQTTGLDLVVEQLKIAAGQRLSMTGDPAPRGHAIEFRINGEDPGRDFLPSPGRIARFHAPSGPWIRVDAGVDSGAVVGGQFDSLLAKLIVTGPDRATALARSRRALAEMAVEGIATVLPFHRAVVEHPDFTAPGGRELAVHTRWIETDFDNQIPPYNDFGDETAIAIGGRQLRVRLPGLRTLGPRAQQLRAELADVQTAVDDVVTPMQGTVVKIAVIDGQRVCAGDLIAVVEAMKMENPVTAHKDGIINGLAVRVGDVPGAGALICAIDSEDGVSG
ncbi:MAG TPA: biotin carboxylase N-terminal domain-containing protein [Mycobacterium sp.]|nr:biotin carboxylase N-terminal domain-containing protein [Mycobacterium sp.]